MSHWPIILGLLLALCAPGALALAAGKMEGKGRSRASSGASQAQAAGACIEKYFGHQEGGDCTPDSDADNCVGLRVAIENSVKQSRCFSQAGGACLLHGHIQNSQPQWVAVAAGFVAASADCVAKHYGSEESRGYAEALADPNFQAVLTSLNDGGRALGMNSDHEIFLRVLQGERLDHVLLSSSYMERQDDRLRAEVQRSALTPMPVIDPVQKPEDGETRVAGSMTGPAFGMRRASRRPASIAPGDAPATRSAGASTAPQNTPTIPTFGWQSAGAAARPAPSPPATDAPSDRFVRRVQANPYSLGLDLTLFDRVSLVYQKRSPALQTMDAFIRHLPKKPAEPSDVRELLVGGRAVEL